MIIGRMHTDEEISMNLITIENLSKSYGEKVLLNDVSMTVNDDDKIGIIGVNGAGKSTLLKIIQGIEDYDSGEVKYMKGIRIEYLSQQQEFDPDATILEQVFKGASKEMETIREYERVLDAVEDNPDDANLQEELMEWSSVMKQMDLWDYESQVKTILTKLGIHHFEKKVGELSGGQRKGLPLRLRSYPLAIF